MVATLAFVAVVIIAYGESSFKLLVDTIDGTDHSFYFGHGVRFGKHKQRRYLTQRDRSCCKVVHT